MIRDLSRFQTNQYDVLIVGGGINGAAIAYLSALVGARVALVEKNDFASGTSSKSTKLLHGGIRYLENFEFDLVAESLKERYIQYKNAPHLVSVLPFVIPVYKNDPRPLWMMKLGTWAYDFLSGPYSVGKRKTISKDKLLELAPHIRQEGLIGAVSYCDAQMNDARICLENVLMADSKGAHVANHVEVLDFIKENGKCTGAKVKDSLTGNIFEIKAKTVIVTAGPWADGFFRKDSVSNPTRLRLTKGVHVLYKGQISEQAFLLQSSSDRRIFFIIPFRGNSLIGTTDTDYEGKPDDVKVEDKDIDYLLKEASRTFPQFVFKKEHIISTFAGLRPLVHERGSPSKISRKHSIEKTFSGTWYVLGGKYTTYRAIAKECVQKVLPSLSQSLPEDTKHLLYGSGSVSPDVKQLTKQYGVGADVILYLAGLYGSRYEDVLKLINDDSSLRVKLCSCSPAIRAQVVYSYRIEMAKNIDDIYLRRLQLQYNNCPSGQCHKTIEEMLNSHAV